MTMRAVFLVGTWPENDYEDIKVRIIEDGESDEYAIKKAKLAYGENGDYYITELKDPPKNAKGTS